MSNANVRALAPFYSLANVAATSNGAPLVAGSPRVNVSAAVTLAFVTSPSAVSTQLKGSMDGVNWYNVGSANTSNAAGTVLITPAAGWGTAAFFRTDTTITGGANVALTAVIGCAE